MSNRNYIFEAGKQDIKMPCTQNSSQITMATNKLLKGSVGEKALEKIRGNIAVSLNIVLELSAPEQAAYPLRDTTLFAEGHVDFGINIPLAGWTDFDDGVYSSILQKFSTLIN